MIYKYQNISFYYEKYGKGKNTILILPGWGDTRKTFTPVIQYFQKNYTVYILDYPGFGYSEVPNQELNMNDYVKLIKNFMKELKIINPIIIAHSFGGRITSLLTTKYKVKVRKIILIDVAGIKRRKKIIIFIKEKIYKLLKKMIRLFPLNYQEILKQQLLKYFASADYQVLPVIMRKTFQNIINQDLKKYYQEIKEDTLILWGENDLDTPLKDAYYLRRHIANSALIVFKNASHFPYLQYPYLTNCIIEEFIKEKQV